MKKLTTVSLFIFFVVATAILTAGLVFYQNNKNQSAIGNTGGEQTDLVKLVTSGIKTLDMGEVAKHSTSSDCWMVINNKVYDMSGYATAHPGGARNIENWCGKEATQAFDTKGGQGGSHSGRANNMLADFYVGDLNQKIDQKTIDQNVQKAKSISATTFGSSNGGGESESENDD